jgi:site-specific DNA-cytosine methylase
MITQTREITHAHLFCGLGGGAKGFNQGEARVGNTQAKFTCLGGIDVDPASIKDFGQLAGIAGTVMDLFSREQYIDFHGRPPPHDWREATPDDIRRAFQYRHPNIIFLSAPCKGFSGLLAESLSKTKKYQALNGLTLRGVWLSLEAHKDDPVELYIFENVPRIGTRGRHLLDQIVALFRAYGYVVAETTHDCGEIGGLAQSRKRFLLVARHATKVPPFLYEPEKKTLKPVGNILGRMPMPGNGLGGPMHRIPALQWKTWVRLAFVEPGSDWRSLNKLRVVDGKLADYLIVPDYRAGFLGVNRWDEPMGTVQGQSLPSNGNFSVADPRMNTDTAANRHKNVFRIVRFDEAAGTISGGHGPSSGGQCVADPRHQGPAKHSNEYRVAPWTGNSCAVTGAHGTGQCVADPRILHRQKGENFYGGGHYGVLPWDAPSGAVSSAAGHDNGRWSVADPRMPAVTENLVAVIRALDNTWHRPFTTLELAALQSLLEPEEHFELEGLSDSAWRERIGNAVPSSAAKAIAGVMGTTLLLAASGETFMLSSMPIWVRNVALSLSVKMPAPEMA